MWCRFPVSPAVSLRTFSGEGEVMIILVVSREMRESARKREEECRFFEDGHSWRE